MENKKILNRIILFFSALIIITFSVFYKDLIAITVDNKWIKILYFIVIYLSIACTAVGLIISLACGFKDEYDIIWFVQFLNLCAFLLTTITAFLFAFYTSTAINLVYLFFCLEYFLLNSINIIIQTICNFKFFKKDLKSVFTNGEPDKSYRYGLEKDIEVESGLEKSKAEKYDLLKDNINELEKEPQDEEINVDSLVKEEDITNNENTINAMNEDSAKTSQEDALISVENDIELDNSADESYNKEYSSKNEFEEISNKEAKELSDTITFIEDEDLTSEQKRIDEIQEDVDKIIKENKKKKTKNKDKNTNLKKEIFESDNNVSYNPDVKNKVSLNLSDGEEHILTYNEIDDSIKDEDIDEKNLPKDDFANLEESAPDAVLNAQNENSEIEKKEKKAEAKLKEKETKASKISILNKFISR